MKMNWDKAVEFKFNIKDEDSLLFEYSKLEEESKSTKDKTIEQAMNQVSDALSGKNFRRMLGAIEQQIRYAYKQGYEEGEKSTLRWRNTSYMKEARQEGYDAGYEEGLQDGKNKAVTATEEELQKKYEMGVKDGRISSLASYDIGKKDGFKDGYVEGHDIGYDKAIEVALREWKRKKMEVLNEDK